MKQNILKQAADYSKRRRKEVRRYRVIGVLAAFVVFCTTYALIMPAITMEHPQCGLEEHAHAKACYEDVLVCGLEESEDVGHVHTDACYEVTTEEVLTCTQEVGGHQHTDACYTKETVTKYKTITVEETETVMEETTEMVSVDDYETQVVGQDEEGNDITQSVKVGSHEEPRTVSRPVTKVIGSHEERVEDGTEEVFTLTCGEDVSGHQHGDSCYQTVEHRTLICTEPEGTPGHHHTEACYEHKLICTIPEHTHTDACYPEKNGDQSIIEGDQSVIEGDQSVIEGEQPELPTVDSEGYVIDADGNRVANEDGTYTQYQVGEDGALVLDEDGNPILAEAAEEITEPVEIDDVTVDGQLYQLVFHVTYNGEQAENDEFVFTPNVLDIAEDETERTYEYTSLISSSLIQPMGRTEFTLTRNGETVDRSEYTVSVEIIPSRMAMAWLIQSGGYDTMEELNLTEETEDGETVTVTPGFVANEIMGGELYPAGHIDIDLETLDVLRFDLESYMAAMYDENGEMNPDALYDTDYAFTAEIQGEDFLMTTGLANDIIEELNSYDQGNWDDRIQVWWDEFNVAKDRVANSNVASVSLIHSDSDGNTEEGATVHSVNRGNGDSPGSTSGLTLGGAGNVFPNAVKAEDQFERVYNINNATHIKSGNEYYERGTTYWNENANKSGAQLYRLTNASNRDYAVLRIKPQAGYYVSKVTIVCAHEYYSSGFLGIGAGWKQSPATDCGIWSSGGAFDQSFTVAEDNEAEVTVNSAMFAHGPYDGDGAYRYRKMYILVQTTAIPAPLYVQYDAGEMKDIFAGAGLSGANWLDNTNARDTETHNVTQANPVGLVDKLVKTGRDNRGNAAWKTETVNGVTYVSDLRYTTAGIAAIGEGNATEVAAGVGKRFAGWQIEYFNEASAGNNIENVRFSDSYGKVDKLQGAKTQVDLLIHARLIAIWEDIHSANVTKEVKGLEDGDLNYRTFNFTVTDATGAKVKTFSLQVQGNGTATYEVCGLPNGEYTVTEDNADSQDQFSAKFRTSYSNEGRFTVTNDSKGRDIGTYDGEEVPGVTANVINSFASTVEVTIEKVTPADPNAKPDPNVKPSTADGTTWSKLGGAEFELYQKGEDENYTLMDTVIISGDGNPDHAKETRELTPGDYKLVETKAPAGYNQLTEEIYFNVSTAGVITLKNADGTDAEANANVNVDNVTLIVANYGGYVLPSTGGAGTLMYTLGGGMLMMACALVLVYKKTQRKGAREI